MKSREEVEALKKEWEEEPCFDLIYDVEGFEEYREELKAFQDKKLGEIIFEESQQNMYY